MVNFQTKQQYTESTEVALSTARSIFETLKSLDTRPNGIDILHLYNEMLRAAEQASASANLLSNVHPDAELRAEAEKMEQAISKFYTEVSLSTELYAALSEISPDGFDDAARRFHKNLLRDFRRSGVDKDAETRVRVAKLVEELVMIGQDFGRNIREDVRSVQATREQLTGLPEDFIAAHTPDEQGMYTLTTDYPDLYPVMSYAADKELRYKLFVQFHQRAYPQNIEVLKAMITKRHELATLLGYKNWADYATEDKMIRSGAAVADFIQKINEMAAGRARADYEQMLAKKQELDPGSDHVEVWERAYLDEIIKRDEFKFDSQEVRPYFEYDRVKQGLLDLSSELYGLRYTKRTDVPVWHPSVEVYDVERDVEPLGRIYLDMHPRENKYKHAAQFTVQSGVFGKQLPEGTLVCNFSDPSTTSPALLDHSQVTTFFHEFGHLLHHVLGGKQEWLYFSGVATEWDFVEAPSQFFEEWAWDPGVLARFAHHYETGAVIPPELIQAMRASDEVGKGLFARRQMYYAAISLNYYNRDPESFDPHTLAETLNDDYQMFRYVPDTHTELNFGHLDGYSAIYYTYMWSLVIAKDLLSKFQEAGLMDLPTAREYARTVLQPGGSKDAADLVKDFLGRPYSFDAFHKWLTV